MSYRNADLKAKLATLFPPETEFQVALIADFSSTLGETNTVAQWLALEVNTAQARATFTTPALSGYLPGSFFIGAYFNVSISIVNAGGSLLEWSHYAILDLAGNLKGYITGSSSQSANTNGSRDIGIRIQYIGPSSGG